jgi:uncharacterized paraquat-inducible protein A
MFSKRRLEGELTVDDRASGGALFESATTTCSHCNKIVVLNPDRQRPRGYCSRCDHYICDSCDERNCLPIRKLFDQLLEAAFRREIGMSPLVVNGVPIDFTNWHIAHDWKGKR